MDYAKSAGLSDEADRKKKNLNQHEILSLFPKGAAMPWILDLARNGLFFSLFFREFFFG